MDYSKKRKGYGPRWKVSDTRMSEIEQPPQENSYTVPIKWNVPSTIQSQYASNMFVQSGEYDMNLLFFDTQVPVFVGSPEEMLDQLKKIEAVEANCVAKIVVHPDLVPKLIKALQTGLDKHLTARQQQKEEGGNDEYQFPS